VRADISGYNIHTFVSGVGAITDIATQNGFVFWSRGMDYGIGRVHENGTGFDPNFISLSDSLFEATGLGVDSQYIYFAQFLDHGRIGRAALDGTNVNLSLVDNVNAADVAVEPN